MSICLEFTMHSPRGFSFIEVMFAIFILGLGFIMVAAVFPVAIQQTQSTADEAVAAGLAREAIDTIRFATSANDFVNGDPQTTFTNVSAKVSSSEIDSADPRYAWVPVFSAPADEPMQVTILVLRRQIHNNYLPGDISTVLATRGVSVNIIQQADGSYRVDVLRDDTGTNKPGYCKAVAPGAFLVLGQGSGGKVVMGKVVRVGQYLFSSAETDSYLLDPGYGIDGDCICQSTSAKVVGREFKDVNQTDLGCDGPAQDIGAFTTFIGPN